MLALSRRSLAVRGAAIFAGALLIASFITRPALASRTPPASLGIGAAWSLVDVPATPASVAQVASAFDPVRRQLIVFGGMNNNLDLTANLSTISVAGPTLTFPPQRGNPVKRYGATMVYDSNHDRMLVFGGKTDGGVVNELWALSLPGAQA